MCSLHTIDYNKEMKKILENNNYNKVLLHSCCGPCSSSVILKLQKYLDVVVIFYNPNIEPVEEYYKRKNSQISLLEKLNIRYIDAPYDNHKYTDKIKDIKYLGENTSKCMVCYYFRLDYTAKMAKKHNINLFATTLSVSPHKDVFKINQIGLKIEEKHKIKFLLSDFKKEDGYLNSIKLSKKHNLYRQNYCGCLDSRDYEK